VPVIAGSYDSFDLNDDPTKGSFLQHVDIDEEWMGEDNTPLQVAGVFARPRRLHRLVVNYSGHVQSDPDAGNQRASVRGYLTTFETTFIHSTHGTLTEQLEDGSTRSLDVRPLAKLTPGPVPEFWIATIAFASYESPIWDVTPAGS